MSRLLNGAVLATLFFFPIIILSIGSIYFSGFYPFYKPLPSYVLTLYFCYMSLSFASVLFFFVVCGKRFYCNISIYFYHVHTFLTKDFFFVKVLFLFFSFFYAYKTMDLVASGVGRHALVFEYQKSYFNAFFSGVVTLLFSFVVFFSRSSKVVVLTGLVFLLFLIATLDRSGILRVVYYIYFIFILTFFFNRRLIPYKRLLCAVILLMVFLFLVSAMQGRGIDSFYSALSSSLKNVFLYHSFSFYLSDIALPIASSSEKLFFPFFGAVSEKILMIFFTLEQPVGVGVDGSAFVMELHSLGHGHLVANVLYPWWIWFHGPLSYAGLFVYFIFINIILFFLNMAKLYFSLFYFVFVLSLSSFSRHPLLNSDSLYSFASIVFLDCIIYFFYLRGLNVKRNNSC